MTVAELIIRLKEFDSRAVIYVRYEDTGDGAFHYPAKNVSQLTGHDHNNDQIDYGVVIL